MIEGTSLTNRLPEGHLHLSSEGMKIIGRCSTVDHLRREGGREGGKEGGREGRKEGKKEGGREAGRGKNRVICRSMYMYMCKCTCMLQSYSWSYSNDKLLISGWQSASSAHN